MIKDYTAIIHAWNMKQIETYLDVTSVDIIIRRAWYDIITSAFMPLLGDILNSGIDTLIGLEALCVVGASSGFILSPVDNVRDDTPNSWINTYEFIDTWKKHRQDFL